MSIIFLVTVVFFVGQNLRNLLFMQFIAVFSTYIVNFFILALQLSNFLIFFCVHAADKACFCLGLFVFTITVDGFLKK